MKKIMLLSTMFLFGGLTLSAQCTKATTSEGKACCASKKVASADAKQNASNASISDAESAAMNNPNIQKRVCEKSGAVTYFEKSVCEHSGSVSWNEVTYNPTEKKFTRVASAGMERNPTTGEVKSTTTKACCKGGAAKSCSKDEKKACAGDKKENN